MRENTGRGWVDRGPRTAVKGWDSAMRGCKPNVSPPKSSDEEKES